MERPESPKFIAWLFKHPYWASLMGALALGISFSPKTSAVATLFWLIVATVSAILLVLELPIGRKLVKSLLIVGVILIMGFYTWWQISYTVEPFTIVPIISTPPPPNEWFTHPQPLAPVTPVERKKSPQQTAIPSESLPVEKILSLMAETRITCTPKQGASIKQGDVPFVGLQSVSSSIQGPAGSFKLSLGNNLGVWLQEDNSIILTNRFFLPADSDLIGRQIATLDSMDRMVLFPEFLETESSIENITFAEITVKVNGKPFWSISGPMNHPHPKSLQITIDVKKFHRD